MSNFNYQYTIPEHDHNEGRLDIPVFSTVDEATAETPLNSEGFGLAYLGDAYEGGEGQSTDVIAVTMESGARVPDHLHQHLGESALIMSNNIRGTFGFPAIDDNGRIIRLEDGSVPYVQNEHKSGLLVATQGIAIHPGEIHGFEYDGDDRGTVLFNMSRGHTTGDKLLATEREV